MLLSAWNENETPIHYELKQIAKYLLWKKGYHCIATEVGGFHDFEIKLNGKHCHKNVIDVVGAKTNHGTWRNGRTTIIKLMGIEAKVSLADFRNGYCTACEYTYIVAPVGIIPHNEILDGVGLIEVDLDNYKLGRYGTEIWHKGINYTILSKLRLSPRFKNKEDRYRWALAQFPRIAYRSASENIWNCAKIEIYYGKEK
jgi:hypothetical protein